MTTPPEKARCSVAAFETLSARVDALTNLLNEREDRNMERFVAARERVDLALVSADKALLKAEAAVERRLDTMNEFRGALTDQANMLMPRSEYVLGHAVVIEKIERLTERVASLESGTKRQAAGISVLGAVALGGFAFLSAMAAFAAALSRWLK